MGEFRSLCIREKMNELKWPNRDYFIQIARFDPAKGIPNVIDSYARFRKLYASRSTSEDDIPQLLICGHGAVDDPDASIIYDQVSQLIYSDAYNEYAKDIVVMRLPPSDQRKVMTGRFCVAHSIVFSVKCSYVKCQDRSPAVHS